MNKDINTIKAFLKARTAEELQELMLQNNIKTRAYHDYRIIYTGTNWYAWFESQVDDYIKDKLDVKRQRSRTK